MNNFIPSNAQELYEFSKQVADRNKAIAERNAQPYKQTEELEKQTEQMQEQTSIISDLKEITEQNIKSSKEYNDASKRTAKVSLWLSIIAIAISIGFGVANNRSSNNWQKEQIKELKSQNQLLNQINENFKKYQIK